MEKGNRKLHFLDRYLGIPLVYFLGLFRSKNKKIPTEVNRIAIINLVSIGDNVLMSAVIADIRSEYPDVELTVFTGTTNYALVKLIEGVSHVVKLPITHILESIGLLRSSGKFDIVIDFVSWPRLNAVYTFFTKAKYRIGFKVDGHYKHYVYDSQVQHRHDIHEIDNLRNLIKEFYDSENHLPALKVIPTDKSTAFVNKIGSYCVIHAWPGGYKNYLKQWDKSRWADLIQKISDEFDSILITGSPGDMEKSKLLESMVDKKQLNCELINISGDFSLQELLYIIDRSACVISIDTGISHVAAALNKPLICIQGPASSLRWRPYNKESIVINPDKGTYGYLSFGFEYYLGKENCMDNISVDTVYSAFRSLIENNKVAVKFRKKAANLS